MFKNLASMVKIFVNRRVIYPSKISMRFGHLDKWSIFEKKANVQDLQLHSRARAFEVKFRNTEERMLPVSL